MDKNKILQLLEEADWEDIGYRLIWFSIKLAKKYQWQSGNPSDLAGGKKPEDIAYDAIRKVLDGTRDWNPDKYPNLLIHLQYIVRSDMGHLFQSYTNQKSTRSSDIETKESDTPESQYITSVQKNPGDELISKEQKILEDTLKEKLYKEVNGDDELEMILLLIDDGIGKPEIIAREMGIEVSKVNTLKRKLIRKGKKIVNFLNSSNEGDNNEK